MTLGRTMARLERGPSFTVGARLIKASAAGSAQDGAPRATSGRTDHRPAITLHSAGASDDAGTAARNVRGDRHSSGIVQRLFQCGLQACAGAQTCHDVLSRLPPPLSVRPRLLLGSASMHFTLYPASCACEQSDTVTQLFTRLPVTETIEVCCRAGRVTHAQFTRAWQSPAMRSGAGAQKLHLAAVRDSLQRAQRRRRARKLAEDHTLGGDEVRLAVLQVWPSRELLLQCPRLIGHNPGAGP